MPGFAPIVERRSKRSTRLEVLPERTLFLSAELRRTHTLICGRIGAGKTNSWILPMLHSDLADTTRTVMVIDAKGELYGPVAELTARYRPGTEVELLNFKEPGYSLGWNMLSQVSNEGQASRAAGEGLFLEETYTDYFEPTDPFDSNLAERRRSSRVNTRRLGRAPSCPSGSHKAALAPCRSARR